MIEHRLSPRETRIWSAVKNLSDTVLVRIQADIERASGLSGADFGVLSRLEDLGSGKLIQQDLATSMGWDKSRLSHHLTRMQKRKLVEREPQGRGVLVVMLAAGRAALKVARPAHAESLRKHLLKKLTHDQAETLLTVFSKISV